MTNNIPYLIRNKTPTLLALSATALALLLTGPMLFSNPLLLQPVQAQTPITFKTPTPAVDPNLTTRSLTFDAQGTLSSDSTEATIRNGTFQVTDTNSGQTLYNGSIHAGSFTNSTDGENIYAYGDLDYPAGGGNIGISTSCSASINNDIQFGVEDDSIGFQGVVECSKGEVNAIAQSSPSPSSPSSSTPSSLTAGSSQDTDRGGSSNSSSNRTDSNSGSSSTSDSNSKDGDRDGIPDSSDKCTHNSNPKCFKEGGDTSSSTTTTPQQQPSSNRTGNQTR